MRRLMPPTDGKPLPLALDTKVLSPRHVRLTDRQKPALLDPSYEEENSKQEREEIDEA
jgi:hypothetical protein